MQIGCSEVPKPSYLTLTSWVKGTSLFDQICEVLGVDSPWRRLCLDCSTARTRGGEGQNENGNIEMREMWLLDKTTKRFNWDVKRSVFVPPLLPFKEICALVRIFFRSQLNFPLCLIAFVVFSTDRKYTVTLPPLLKVKPAVFLSCTVWLRNNNDQSHLKRSTW